MPEIAGNTLFTGTPTGAATTTPDCTLVTAAPGPAAFDAVTRTRNVEPKSPATNTYDGFVRTAQVHTRLRRRCYSATTDTQTTSGSQTTSPSTTTATAPPGLCP